MKILIIEDHPFVVESYVNSLSQKHVFAELPKFVIARTCKEAFNLVEETDVNLPFDLAIIDQRLPIYSERNILCGAHLAPLIKDKYKNCKIIVVTSHSEIVMVYDLLKKVEPHGFLIKNDVSDKVFCEGVKDVLLGNRFYSATVKTILENVWNNDLMMDVINREILIFLSKGYKVNELSSVVSLSVSSIKRRISQMKAVLNVKEDSNLIKEAIQLGYL